MTTGSIRKRCRSRQPSTCAPMYGNGAACAVWVVYVAAQPCVWGWHQPSMPAKLRTLCATFTLLLSTTSTSVCSSQQGQTWHELAPRPATAAASVLPQPAQQVLTSQPSDWQLASTTTPRTQQEHSTATMHPRQRAAGAKPRKPTHAPASTTTASPCRPACGLLRSWPSLLLCVPSAS